MKTTGTSSRHRSRVSLPKLLLLTSFLAAFGIASGANRVWTGNSNNDFNNALNWNTFVVPGAGDTATINLTGTKTITLSANVTLARLVMTMAGNTKTGILDVGAYSLTITGTTYMDVTSGNNNTFLELGVNGGASPGIIDFGGDVTASVTAKGKCGFIGGTKSTFIFRSNLTFGPHGYINTTNIPDLTYFDATTAQTITYNNTVSAIFGSVVIGGANNPTVTLAGTAAAADIGVAGNLTVNGTSVFDLGTLTCNRSAAGGTLALNSNTQLLLAAATGGQTGSNFPLNFSTMTLSTTSTVEYKSAGGVNQTIYAGAVYGHLTLSQGSGSGGTTKSATAALTIAGSIQISAGATFSASSFTHNLKGLWINNGTFTQGTSTIHFNGTSAQSILGSSANTFFNLTLNNAAGLTLLTDITVNNTCTLTSGIVTTGSYTVIIPSGGSVSRTSGHVYGYLQKYVNTGPTNITFEVGGASAYAPVSVSFGSVTTAGVLTASSLDGDHSDIANSGIDATKSVNRNWSLTNGGIAFSNYSATFTFVPGDIDGGANTANFIVRKLDLGTWSATTVGARTGTTTQATAMTTFSEFQIGEQASLSISCPSNFTVGNDPGLCNADVSYTGSQAATSPSTPTPVITYTPAGPFAVGTTTTVTATATNINGSVQCTFDVTVMDDEAPVISNCNDIEVCGLVATWPSLSASDNCGLASFTGDYNSGDTFPLGTTTVTYTATDIHGNTASCQFNVTTHDAPFADAGSNQTGCHSGTFTLNGSIGGEATTSTWTTAGDGTFDDSSLLAAVYTPGPNDSIAGFVTLTLTTDDPAGPCSAASDVMNITFDYVPAKPDAVVGPGPLTACNTDVFSYTTNSAAALSYTWTSMLPASASITNGQGTNTAEITFGVLPLYTSYYPFTVTANNACGASEIRTFSIQNIVGVPIFDAGLQTVVCPNTAGIDYSVRIGPGVSTYNWTVPSGATIVAGAGTNAITVDFDNTFVSGDITVSASNACMTSAIRKLFIDSRPPLPGAISGSSSVCPGTNAFSVTPVTGAATYAWTVPSGVTIQSGSGTNAITALFSPGWQSGNITVTAYSGCSPSTKSATRSKNVSSPLPPVPASVTGTATNLCGQTVTYTCPSVTGATSYDWTLPAALTLNSGQGSTSISVTYPSSGFSIGDVCVSASTNLCTAPDNTNGSRCLTVKAYPDYPGAITGPATVCPSFNYTYSVTNVPGQTYAWTVPTGTVITNGAGTNSIDVTWGANVGYMNVTAFNGCGGSNTSVKLIAFGSCRIAAQGGQSGEEAGQFSAYPNPAHDRVNLSFSSAEEGAYDLRVMDLTGRITYRSNGTVVPGSNQVELQLGNFPQGIYIAVLHEGGRSHTVRIVKN